MVVAESEVAEAESWAAAAEMNDQGGASLGHETLRGSISGPQIENDAAVEVVSGAAWRDRGNSPLLGDPAQCATLPPPRAISDVTLVMHTSSERLWMLPHICTRWGGPMVMVALRGPDSGMNGRSLLEATAGGSNCSLLRLEVGPPSELELGTAYPINWLRNQGIRCVATTHYLVADVDFWPSTELRQLIRQQLPGWTPSLKRALVLPNFQRSGHGCRNSADLRACRTAFDRGDVRMPATFEDLHDCLGKNDCSVFDSEFNALGQSSTDTAHWKRLEFGQLMRITCLQSERYEPFVVLSRSDETPIFDERFTGYGKNKVEFVVHLRYAGYMFEVLGRGFLVHFPHPKSHAKAKWLHTSAHVEVEHLYSEWRASLKRVYLNVSTQRTPICPKRQIVPQRIPTPEFI